MRTSSCSVQSWRFEVGDAPALAFAVRCRDELRLPVAPAPDVPPTTTVAGGASPIPDASEQWLTWWRLLLDRTSAGLRRATLDGDQPRASQVLPISDALDLIDSGPLLHYAATVAALPAHESPRGSHPLVAMSVVEDAVDETARRTSVPAGVLQGAVHLLPGPASWLAVVRPGYGLMTVGGVVPDDDILRHFVCDVLESGLSDHGQT